MKVLIACEYSQIVTKTFLDNGHDAWSCDIIDTEGDPSRHFKCDVREILNNGWDLMIAHPECRFLTNAGVRHLYSHVKSKNGKVAEYSGEKRWKAMREAADFFNELKNASIPRIAIENPIPHKHATALIGKYDQLVRPWMFGETSTKAICLWLKNLPLLKPTQIIHPPKDMTLEDRRIWHSHHLCPDTKRQSKIRSKFFENVGKAMSNQWG